ncbi:hypothetical protein F4808DRAFT_473706 [Astrocystis sublimbata]|nr:hypothetical protein F4808DRAFT_473706 [Astrocystis sublimbata]
MKKKRIRPIPPSLPTWAELYYRLIDSLVLVRGYTKHIFVAIDIRCDENKNWTDIGIGAYAPPPTSTILAAAPPHQDLHDFYRQQNMSCSWLRVEDMRPVGGDKDICNFASVEEFNPIHVVGVLYNLLVDVRRCSQKNLILVGFGSEMNQLITHLGQFAPVFSERIDLQDMVMRRSDEPSRKPALWETLRAMGFHGCDWACANRRLNPADECIRELAVFVRLLSFGDSTKILLNPKNDYSKHKSLRRNFYGGPPEPKALYPFTARIRRIPKDDVDDGPLPEGFGCAWPSDIYPVATGWINEYENYWGSFESLQILDKFIASIHGKEFKGYMYTACSEYDPSIKPITPDQYRAAQKEEVDGIAAQLERTRLDAS